MNDAPTSEWKAGRGAAAALFVGGSFWAWNLFPKTPNDWPFYAAGFIIWLLWGMRAMNIGSPTEHRVVWFLSFLVHLCWLGLAALATALSGGFALFAVPIQIIWCLIATMISFAFVIGGSDA